MHLRTLRISALLLLGIFILLLLQFFPASYDSRLSEAEVFLKDWNLPEAVTHLRLLASDYPDSVSVRRMFAEGLLRRGEIKDARREYEHLVGSDTTNRISNMLSLALSLYYLGDLQSSDSIAREALESLSDGQNHILLAKGYYIIGRVLFDRASYDSALQFQRKSLDHALLSESLQEEADALRQIGVLYWYAGKTDSAHQVFYDSALSLYRRINDRIGEATTLNNIGLATGGVEYCLQAFAIRKQIGDQIGLADSYYFVTSPLPGGYWNDLDYAFRIKSLRLSTQIGYAWGKDVAARAVDQMVFFSFDSLRFTPGSTDTTGTFGESMIHRLQTRSVDLARQQKWREATFMRERIVFLCDSMGYAQGLGMALAQYADALSMTGNHDLAEKTALRLKTVWVESPSADAVLAKVYHGAGRFRKAIPILQGLVDHYDELYRAVMSQRSLTSSLGGGRLLYARLSLYEMLIDCLTRVNDVSPAFIAMEQVRSIPIGYGISGGREDLAQRYYDALNAIESGDPSADALVKQFADAYSSSRDEGSHVTTSSRLFEERRVVNLGDVQRQLQAGEVVLEYFLGIRNAYVCVIVCDDATLLRLEASIRDLNSAARAFPELILRGKTAPGDSLWKGPASFLYSLLLQPASTVIQEGQHLIISPHGLLHGVPFAALVDENRRLVVNRFAISMVRTAGEIVVRREEPRHPDAIAFVPDRATLEFAEKEAGSIPSKLFNRTILLDGQATTREFLERSPEADLIHIAAHGSANRLQPFFSQLQLWDGPLELHQILQEQFSARLVVLSACESGYGAGMLGDVSYGHVIVSFPNAFLSAGASCVLAPLWIVEDQSTAILMSLFYSSLVSLQTEHGPHSRSTYPEALAMAQRQFIGQSAAPHPFYWAGFQINS